MAAAALGPVEQEVTAWWCWSGGARPPQLTAGGLGLEMGHDPHLSLKDRERLFPETLPPRALLEQWPKLWLGPMQQWRC